MTAVTQPRGTAVDPAVPPPAGPSPLRAALRSLARRPAVLAAAGWIALVVLASALAGPLSPHDPLEQDIGNALAGPSGAHLLGTDELGRDLLSRLLHGGGYLLAVALVPVAVSYLIGVFAGLLVGYVGGWADSVADFVVNVMLSVPSMVVILAVAVATDTNLLVLTVVFGILGSAGTLRLVRATTRSARELLYVDAAKVAGLPTRRILARHILPNVAGPLVVQAFLLYSGTFMFLNSLSFLGLGFSPEKPSWGQLVYAATQHLEDDPWQMAPIGVALIATVLALNSLGAAVLDVLPTAQRDVLLSARRRAPRHETAPPAARTRGPRTDDVAGPTDPGPGPDGVLVVDRLTVALDGPRGEQPVIEDVSLHIGRGESVGLVGESGSGKTITALAVLGLLPPSARVRSGRVLLGGQDLIRLSERELGRVRGTQVAYVSQEPMVALDPCFTVGSQLVEPLRLHSGAGRTASRARALELLRLVGIPRPEAVARSHPHQLSGGMAQRVAIALALTGEPDLLVADEPTTALDVTVQAEILDLLHSLQGELGMSLLLVTHDLAVVADLCDRVAVMYAGEIVELGAAEEVLLRPAHPYTRALLDATPRPAAGRPLRIVEGSVPGPGRRAAWCRFADRCGHVTDTCRSGPVPLLPPGPPAPPDGTRAEQLSRCLRSAEILERNPR